MGRTKWKRVGVGIGLLLVLAVACYAAYVLLSYYRLEDNLPLMISQWEQALPYVETGESCRVVSYNIGFGAYSADYTFFMDAGKESRARSAEAVEENVSGALAAVEELSPDLVLFQEVDVEGTRSCHVDELAIILRTMEGYSSTFAQNYDSPYLLWPLTAPHGANRSGQATVSRFAISSALRRRLPVEEGLMKLVDLDRCYSVQRIPVDNGRELVVYNLHLSAYTSDGSIATEQMELLFGDMAAEYQAGNYVVAGGDFNRDLLGDSDAVFGVSGEGYTWAQPVPDGLVPDGLTLVAPLDPENPVPSCRNADRPYGPDSYVLTVDGFVVSDNVEILDQGVADTMFQWSDHNPVYMDVVLRP